MKVDLDTPEAAQALKEFELSRYTTKEIKDELKRREDPTEHYECNMDITNQDFWYCQDHDVEGTYS